MTKENLGSMRLDGDYCKDYLIFSSILMTYLASSLHLVSKYLVLQFSLTRSLDQKSVKLIVSVKFNQPPQAHITVVKLPYIYKAAKSTRNSPNITTGINSKL